MNNSYNVTTDLKQQQYIPSQPGSYAPPNQPASSTVLIVPGGGCPSCRVKQSYILLNFVEIRVKYVLNDFDLIQIFFSQGRRIGRHLWLLCNMFSYIFFPCRNSLLFGNERKAMCKLWSRFLKMR